MNKTPLAFRNLGLALLVVRQLSGRTQVELARQAGFSKSQLSKYEKGKDLPKLDSLGRILEVLSLSPRAFFKVLDILDGMLDGTEGEEVSVVKSLVREGVFQAMVTAGDRRLVCGVVKDSTGMFKAQIIVRTNGSKTQRKQIHSDA